MLTDLATAVPKVLFDSARALYELTREDAPNAQRLRMRSYCRGDGIEVGALHNPLALPAYARVRYVDRLSVEDLRAHYPELASQNLVPVSVLATAEDLSAFAAESLDFVVANHLLEHCENPLRALSEFDRVLKPGGVVYLALPDPQHTFDRDRALTTTEHLIAEFRDGPEKNRLAHYVDWSTKVDGRDESHARQLMARSYSIHFHVWNAETFRRFFDEGRREARLSIEIVDGDAGDNEFIYILRKGPSLFDRARRILPLKPSHSAVLRELRSRAMALTPSRLLSTLAQ